MQEQILTFICLCLEVVMATGDKQYVTRKTIYGDVRGFLLPSSSGRLVETYLGIPFATPPVGQLRFERPKKPKAWSGVLDATRLPAACPQMYDFSYIRQYFPGFDLEDEDCLYLNVFVPRNTTSTDPLPVLLYIHGGSNEAGMGAMFSGDVLAGHGKIIVVNFNYRLGPFGFLGAKDEGLEGTYGFLDQVAVMVWVQENIHFFNGDPKKVTIDGHSAGAADVGFHLISPLTKGLFRYAIVQSGSPLAFWAMSDMNWKEGYNVNPECTDYWCPAGRNRNNYKSFLKSLPTKMVKEFHTRLPFALITYPAVIDGHFLENTPMDVFTRGNFHGDAFMLTFTKDEGADHVETLLNHAPKTDNFSEKNFRNNIRLYQTAFRNVCGFDDIIAHEYSDWSMEKRIDHSLYSFIEILTDLVFVAPMIRMANIMSKHTENLYLFRFDHDAKPKNRPEWLGVPHGRDLFYLFGAPLDGHPDYNYTEVDVEASKLLMTVWANFVKLGYLTVDGKTPFQFYNTSTKTINTFDVMDKDVIIGQESNYKNRKMEFWNTLLPGLKNKSCTCEVSVAFDTKKANLTLILIVLIFLFGFS